MPVDPAVVESFVGPYRHVLNEVQATGWTGIEVNEMNFAIAEMDRLANLLEDATAYSAGIANLGLAQRFNDAYARLLANRPPTPSNVIQLPELVPPSDDELLGIVLTAHIGLLEHVRDTPAEPEIGPPLRDAVDLARSGASYPVFLRCLVERGHDLLLENQAMAREPIAAALADAEATGDPARIAYHTALVAAYDELAVRSVFGVPDPFALELHRVRIDAVHRPAIMSRDALIQRWRALLVLVVDWLDAHSAAAATNPRSATGDPAQTQLNIERVRECNPGFAAVRERLLTETWGLAFEGIFSHESFAAEQRMGRVPYDEHKLALVREVRPYCVPGGSPPAELIAHADALLAAAAPV